MYVTSLDVLFLSHALSHCLCLSFPVATAFSRSSFPVLSLHLFLTVCLSVRRRHLQRRRLQMCRRQQRHPWSPRRRPQQKVGATFSASPSSANRSAAAAARSLSSLCMFFSRTHTRASHCFLSLSASARCPARANCFSSACLTQCVCSACCLPQSPNDSSHLWVSPRHAVVLQSHVPHEAQPARWF